MAVTGVVVHTPAFGGVVCSSKVDTHISRLPFIGIGRVLQHAFEYIGRKVPIDRKH